MPEDDNVDQLENTLLGGRYRLLRVLARGGMADVWQAVDERLHRKVAVKVLRDDPDATVDDRRVARRRFAVESRVVARLNHPKIIPVFDAGTDRGISFLVMQQLSGRTLRDRLREGPLTDHEARRLMTDVLAALEAAHDAGLIHRDIKPGNILADTDGGWKVADFGIAKSDDLDDDPSEVNEHGLLVCTPRYTAPERFAGQSATRASDIYSVGVVLGEALAGRDDVDPQLRRAAARAASPNPARRFRAADSMVAALHVDDEPTRPVAFRPAGSPPTSVRAGAVHRRRLVPDTGVRTPLVAAWGVLMLLLTGFAIASVGDREQRGGAAGAQLAPPAQAVASELAPATTPASNTSEPVATTSPADPLAADRAEPVPPAGEAEAEQAVTARPSDTRPEAANRRANRGRGPVNDRDDGPRFERDGDGDGGPGRAPPSPHGGARGLDAVPVDDALHLHGDGPSHA